MKPTLVRDLSSQLVSLLEEITALLHSHGEEHWFAWLTRDANLIRSGDLYGVEHLLSAYGGMGSFTDLFLCPENGNTIAQSDVQSVNTKLRALSSRAYDLARQLHRAA